MQANVCKAMHDIMSVCLIAQAHPKCLHRASNYIAANIIPSASAAVDLSSDAEREDVCSGTTVTFTCRVPAQIALWAYNGQQVTRTVLDTITALLGPFVVTVIVAESNSTFVATTATVNITSELSGTSITCANFAMTETDIATLPDIMGNTLLHNYLYTEHYCVNIYVC